MPMNIIDPDARVTHYCSEFFERLESIGCSDFKTANPKRRYICSYRGCSLRLSALRCASAYSSIFPWKRM